MKKCTRCGVEKPIDCFYADRGMRDGYRNNCKKCCCAYAAVYGKTAKGRAVNLKATQRMNRKYPERYKAVNILNNAVTSGKIIRQPCEKCGEKAQAHHEDYSKPFDVVWLCQAHHMKRHIEIREEAAALDRETPGADRARGLGFIQI